MLLGAIKFWDTKNDEKKPGHECESCTAVNACAIFQSWVCLNSNDALTASAVKHGAICTWIT